MLSVMKASCAANSISCRFNAERLESMEAVIYGVIRGLLKLNVFVELSAKQTRTWQGLTIACLPVDLLDLCSSSAHSCHALPQGALASLTSQRLLPKNMTLLTFHLTRIWCLQIAADARKEVNILDNATGQYFVLAVSYVCVSVRVCVCVRARF